MRLVNLGLSRARGALQRARRCRPVSRTWGRSTGQTPADLDEIIASHFENFSAPNHINRVAMTVALRCVGEKAALVVETGTSAWGTDSTRLWANFVDAYEGELWSVDVREEPSRRLASLGPRTHLVVGDSVDFLKKFSVPPRWQGIDLAYLDSFDLDPASPEDAMQHGLAEWTAIRPLLAPGGVVAIDDTPIDASLLGADGLAYWRSTGVVPGKGALVLADPHTQRDFDIRYHHYQVVLQMKQGRETSTQ